MKIKKIMLVSLLLLAVLTISAVSAADNLTDSNEDVLQDTSSEEIGLSDEDIVSSSQDDLLETDAGTFTALQNMIDNADSGSTITLEADYTYDEGFNTEGIEISKPITINGNGHSINALSKSRIFQITYKNNGNVILNNINFNNGNYDGCGGAIFVKPDYYFAGMYTAISLTVNNCVFTNNHAPYGGAIDCYSLTIKDSIFTKNEASSSGGAIYIHDTSKLTNCDFNNNIASYKGGAIYMNSNDGDRSWTLTECNFNSNKAEDSGGAIYSGEESHINSCTFNLNEATLGGAIDSSGSPFYVKNSIFKSNSASKNGGAIFYYGLSKISSGGYTKVYLYDNLITGSTFENNIAKQDGGAIYASIAYEGKTYVTV